MKIVRYTAKTLKALNINDHVLIDKSDYSIISNLDVCIVMKEYGEKSITLLKLISERKHSKIITLVNFHCLLISSLMCLNKTV